MLDLSEIFGPLDPNRPKCNFSTCFHGGGLAGYNTCHGEPHNPNCPKYESEDKKLAEWLYRRELSRMAVNASGSTKGKNA